MSRLDSFMFIITHVDGIFLHGNFNCRLTRELALYFFETPFFFHLFHAKTFSFVRTSICSLEFQVICFWLTYLLLPLFMLLLLLFCHLCLNLWQSAFLVLQQESKNKLRKNQVSNSDSHMRFLSVSPSYFLED